MTLEIHDLRILRAIAEAGSLAGAARALGTNQGNVSRQLQRIERGTGVTLFRRQARGTTPTAAGRLVLSGAETLLPLIDWLLDTAAQQTGHRPGPTDAVNAPATANVLDTAHAPDTADATYAPGTAYATDTTVATDTTDATNASAAAGAPGAAGRPGTTEAIAPAEARGAADAGDTVRIGSVRHPVLPTLAGALRTLLPGVSLGVHTDESSAALRKLLGAGGLEVALVRHFPHLDAPLPSELESAAIAHEGLLIGVGERHPLAGRRSAALRDLAPGSRVLVDSRNGTLRQHFLTAVEHSGVDLRVTGTADEGVAAAMVCASSAAFPAFPVPAPLPGVVFLPLEDEAARYTLLLAWPRAGRLAAHGTWLTERARHAYPPAPGA